MKSNRCKIFVLVASLFAIVATENITTASAETPRYKYVGVYYHLFHNDDGGAGVPVESYVTDAHTAANDFFAASGSGMVIYNKGISHYNDSWLNNGGPAIAYLQSIGQWHDPLFIDVVSFQSLSFSISSIPSGPNPSTYILIRPLHFWPFTGNGNPRHVLTHELGHWFGLYHTFDKGFGVECVDGSNCDTTGDLVCDTTADPWNGGGGGEWIGCTWTGTRVDSCSNPYPSSSPVYNNIMSGVCDLYTGPNLFTPGQVTRQNEQTQLWRVPQGVVNYCIGDISPVSGGEYGDGEIDIDDLITIINAFGQSCIGCKEDISPDGGNGTVDIDDLIRLINSYGNCVNNFESEVLP